MDKSHSFQIVYYTGWQFLVQNGVEAVRAADDYMNFHYFLDLI